MSRRKKQITELNLKKIGGRIAYIRISNDQTMAKFAEITGLSTGNLSALENYKYEPSFQAIVKIIEHYNVNPGWLITGEGEILQRDEKADTSIYKEGNEGPVDLDLIEKIIGWLDRYLTTNRKTLPPDKKARFVSFAYQYFTDTGKEVDDQTMVKYLRLVA